MFYFFYFYVNYTNICKVKIQKTIWRCKIDQKSPCHEKTIFPVWWSFPLLHLSMPTHVPTQKCVCTYNVTHLGLSKYIIFCEHLSFQVFFFLNFSLSFLFFSVLCATSRWSTLWTSWVNSHRHLHAPKSYIHVRVLFSHSLFYECGIVLYTCFCNLMLFSKLF